MTTNRVSPKSKAKERKETPEQTIDRLACGECAERALRRSGHLWLEIYRDILNTLLSIPKKRATATQEAAALADEALDQFENRFKGVRPR